MGVVVDLEVGGREVGCELGRVSMRWGWMGRWGWMDGWMARQEEKGDGDGDRERGEGGGDEPSRASHPPLVSATKWELKSRPF